LGVDGLVASRDGRSWTALVEDVVREPAVGVCDQGVGLEHRGRRAEAWNMDVFTDWCETCHQALLVVEG
jgi:hypothetical protein